MLNKNTDIERWLVRLSILIMGVLVLEDFIWIGGVLLYLR